MDDELEGRFETDIHKLNEVYFRISTPSMVNWNRGIRTALTALKTQFDIEEITICRDRETDGSAEIRFYRSASGKMYDRKSVELFLTEEISDYSHVYWDDGK